MIIHLAADHAGFALKNNVAEYLRSIGYEVTDHGAHLLDETDDYPQIVATAAHAVAQHPESRGIVFGGSGQGEAIVANRVAGVRAVVWYGGSTEIIRLSREHNDANMLSIGARFVTDDEAREAIRLWLETDFPAEERHARRIAQLDHATS
ncbi:MAG: RpiB/LacA/LacB family sugar-phosphate isomerase [Patescibacteria group bacterium]